METHRCTLRTGSTLVLACFAIAALATRAYAQSAEGVFRDAYYERWHDQSVAAIDFSPDEKLLASFSLDRTIRVANWAERKTLATLTGFSPGDGEGTHDRKLRFVAGGKQLLTAQHQGELQLREWASDKLLWKTLAGGRSLALSPDEEIALTADWESPKLSRWDMKTGKLLGQLAALSVKPEPGSWSQGSVAWSKCGKYFASACGGTRDATAPHTRVVVWEAAKQTPIKEFTIPSLRAHTLQFSPDSSQLAVGTTSGMVHCFYLKAMASDTMEAKRLQGWVQQLDDATFKVRERAQRELQNLGRAELPMLQSAMKKTDSLEAQMRLRDIIALIEARHAERAAPEQLHPGTVLSLAYSPDGRFLVSACRTHQKNQGAIVVRDLRINQVVKKLQGPGVTSVVFSPGGRYLGAAYQDGCVRVWEVNAVATK